MISKLFYTNIAAFKKNNNASRKNLILQPMLKIKPIDIEFHLSLLNICDPQDLACKNGKSSARRSAGSR
jgi:hypothetical protein